MKKLELASNLITNFLHIQLSFVSKCYRLCMQVGSLGGKCSSYLRVLQYILHNLFKPLYILKVQIDNIVYYFETNLNSILTSTIYINYQDFQQSLVLPDFTTDGAILNKADILESLQGLSESSTPSIYQPLYYVSCYHV